MDATVLPVFDGRVGHASTRLHVTMGKFIDFAHTAVTGRETFCSIKLLSVELSSIKITGWANHSHFADH